MQTIRKSSFSPPFPPFLRKRRRFAWVLVIAISACACGLGIAGYLLLFERFADPVVGPEEPQSPLPLQTRIHKVRLKLGAELVVDAPRTSYVDRAHVLRDAQNRTWVLLAKIQSFEFTTTNGQKFLPVEAMPTVGERGVGESSAALTDANLPIVFWQAWRRPGDSVIVSSRWSPEGWSAPVVLDALPTPAFMQSFDAIRDTEGTIHLVYDRHMNPPEEYKKFFIALDGADVYKPYKAFHVRYHGGSWSQPVCTTRRGWFELSRFNLAVDHLGTPYLAGIVSRSNDSEAPVSIVRQFWRNGRWTPLRSLASDVQCSNSRMLSDIRGVTNIWRYAGAAHWGHQQYVDGRLTDVSFPPKVSNPVFKRLPGGQIAVVSEGRLAVWNGEEWSQPIDANATDISVTSTGTMLVWKWDDTAVRIREITLE